MKKETYILFSGGRESLINLHLERERNPKGRIILVFFHYGQKSVEKERDALFYYSEKYVCDTLEFKDFKMRVPTSIIEGTKGNANVFSRNLLFVGATINEVLSRGSKTHIKILLGTVKWRIKGYNDGVKAFSDDLAKLIDKLYPNVKVRSHTDKIYGDDTHRYLIRHKIDTTFLWLCMSNETHHCGKCEKCLTLNKEIFSVYTDVHTLKFKEVMYGRSNTTNKKRLR